MCWKTRDPTRNGTTTKGSRFTYALDGQVLSVTDPADMVTTVAVARAGDPGWNEVGSIAEVQTVTAGTSTTEYKAISTITKTNKSGDVVSVTRGSLADTASLATTTYLYGPLGRLLKETNPTGVSTWYHYDAEGRVTQAVAGPTDGVADRTTTTAYTPFGEIASVATPMGPDLDGQQITSKTCFNYDQVGRAVARIEGCDGPANARMMTGTAYDAAGRPWRTIEHRDGNIDPAQAAAIAAGDKVTETRFTLAGRTAATLTPPADAPSFNWNSGTGKLQISYTYDGAGRVTKLTMPPLSVSGAPREAIRTYDPDGNVATEKTPMGKTTSYIYDDRGLPTTVTTPFGPNSASPQTAVSDLTYDALGRTTSKTDPHLPTTTNPPKRSYSYTPVGELAVATDALDNKVSYRYDGRGNKTEQRFGGANGDLTIAETWAYNPADQMTSHSVQSPDAWPNMRATTYEYEPSLGFNSKIISPTGNTETRSYYLNGTLKQQQWTGFFKTTITSSTSFNNRGWRTKMVDQIGPTSNISTYTYDRAGQPLAVSAPSGTLTYTWDQLGNPTTLSYPDGASGTYTHTSIGTIKNVTVRSASGQPDLPWADYTYDADGNQASEWLYSSGGNSRNWGRDAAGNPSTYSTAVKKPDNTFDTYTSNRTYRPDRRLNTETSNGSTKIYSYDAAGQLTGETGPGGATYTYNNRGNRLTKTTSTGTTAYEYYGSGDVKKETESSTGAVVSYTYDAAGHQLQAKTVKSGVTTQQRDLTYNTRGLVESINELNPSYTGLETGRIYDGDGLLTRSNMGADQSNQAPIDFIWDRTQPIAQVMDASVSGVVRARSDFGNTRISYKISDHFYPQWFKYDANGSPIASDGNSNVVGGPTRYDAYGNPSEDAQYLKFGYRGEYQFGTTLYLRNRNYDPRSGQFLTRDPLSGVAGTSTSTNNYHYTNNDPLNSADPLGLRASDVSLLKYSDNWDPTRLVGDDCSGFRGELKVSCAVINLIAAMPVGADCGPFLDESLCYQLQYDGYRDRLDAALEQSASIISLYGDLLTALVSTSLPGALIPSLAESAGRILHGKGTKEDYVAVLGAIGGGYLALKGGRLVVGGESAGRTASSADHVVLGKSIGLEEQAAKLGGRHLMGSADWQAEVLKAIANPNTKISVVLDGLEGTGTTYSRIISAVQRSASGAGSALDWELAQLYQSGRLSTTSLIERGNGIYNPFG